MLFKWLGVDYGGTAPPTPKIACFVLYLKIINIFLKNNTCIYSKLSKELKNSIKIKVGQAVLELLIQTTFLLLWSMT